MNKDTKNNDNVTHLNSVTFKLIRDGYNLLISNAGYSSRIRLAKNLDKRITPKVGFITWKNRFLYPSRNIPKKNVKFYVDTMLEELSIELQKQMEYVKLQIIESEKIIASNKQKIVMLKKLNIKSSEYINNCNYG